MDPTLTLDRIRGHRLWSVVPHPTDLEPVLASVTTDAPWSEPEMSAVCLPRSATAAHVGRVPDVDCTCGLHAAKQAVTPLRPRLWAQGPVEMWGSVVEGSRGFRAERMRIAGDLRLVVGMGRGAPRCTTPRCREPAAGVLATGRSYLGRCASHGDGALMGFFDLGQWVTTAFERRYGVRARLHGEVAA